MRKIEDPDLVPLSPRVQWWRRSRNRRQAALTTFKCMAALALTLAVSAAGAILISFGVYQMYAPAGWITGGLMCWVLIWSHEQDKRRQR